jgi:hypothetical protein
MLYAVTYLSRSLIPQTGSDIIELARSSLRNNRRLDVTGGLYFDDEHFFQTIEGPEASVAVLYDRIRRDPRHCDLHILHRGPIAERQFPRWSMKFVDGAWLRGAAARFGAEKLLRAQPDEVAERVAELAAA